jgi:hypothetical protein
MAKYYRCNRCQSVVSFEEVTEGYFAFCLMHDEDLYQFETYFD